MHGLGILKEEIKRSGKHDEVGKGHSSQEKKESKGRNREENLALGRLQSRKEESGEQEDQNGKRENHSGIEGELERNGHGVGNTKRLKGRSSDRVDGYQRSLDQGGQMITEKEGADHGNHENHRHPDDQNPEITKMIHEGTRFVLLLPEGEDLVQLHGKVCRTTWLPTSFSNGPDACQHSPERGRRPRSGLSANGWDQKVPSTPE